MNLVKYTYLILSTTLFKILPVYLTDIITKTTSGPHDGGARGHTNESHILCYL